MAAAARTGRDPVDDKAARDKERQMRRIDRNQRSAVVGMARQAKQPDPAAEVVSNVLKGRRPAHSLRLAERPHEGKCARP